MRIHLAAVAALACFAVPAVAQDSKYETTLKACRAAAQAATDADPTGYKCDWKTLVKGSPGAALTGRYDGRLPGTKGLLTVIETGGNALVAISSVNRASTHTCILQATGARGANDSLNASTPAAAGCSVSIVSSGPNLVRVTATSACSTLCGARASFAGTYRLRQ